MKTIFKLFGLTLSLISGFFWIDITREVTTQKAYTNEDRALCTVCGVFFTGIAAVTLYVIVNMGNTLWPDNSWTAYNIFVIGAYLAVYGWFVYSLQAAWNMFRVLHPKSPNENALV